MFLTGIPSHYIIAAVAVATVVIVLVVVIVVRLLRRRLAAKSHGKYDNAVPDKTTSEGKFARPREPQQHEYYEEISLTSLGDAVLDSVNNSGDASANDGYDDTVARPSVPGGQPATVHQHSPQEGYEILTTSATASTPNSGYVSVVNVTAISPPVSADLSM